MKLKALSIFFALFALPVLGIYKVGDKPSNECWKNDAGTDVCLDDVAHVKVLLFSAGWCGPCQSEFSTIAKDTAEFNGKPVTFFSLSAEGWNSRSASNQAFLQDWKKTYKLDKAMASFIVASSNGDFGSDYFSSPKIPSVVILDDSGAVTYKAIAPGMAAIKAQIRKLLPKPIPVPVR